MVMGTVRRFVSVFALVGLAALCFAGQDSLAASGQWSLAGAPGGGSVLTVVVNPNNPDILYAVSGPGIYESTNSGTAWTLVLPLLTNQASDIAIEPENPTTLYAATQGSGVYKTTDGGASWNNVSTGIATIVGGAPDSIYRIAVDPVTDGVAYLATLNTGVYKTSNGGQSWSAINNGISQLEFSGSQINRLLVDPINPQVLYLANNVFTGPGLPGNTSVQGVYTSTNGGANWTASLTGVPAYDVAINPSNDAQVYETNAIGIDILGASGWTGLPTTPPSPYVMRVDPANGNELFVGTYFNGLYQSADGGTTWTADNTGPASYITSIAFDPTNSQTVYISSNNWGVLKSTDGGSTWNSSNIGIQNVQINNIIMGNDGVIYIGTNGQGVYKSIDSGSSWTLVDNGIASQSGLTGITVYALADNPSAPGTVYAGTVIGLFQTTDGGSSWSLLNSGITDPYTTSLAVDPKTPTTVYAGTQTAGVFKSVDNGVSWQAASNGITAGSDVIALTVNPVNDATVYAGTSSAGIFRSTDGGNTWASDNSGMPVTGVWAIAVDPQNPNTVYASVQNYDVYKSTDGGQSWLSASNGIPPGYIVSSIEIDPQNTQILYATLLDNYGVYESSDGGASWTLLNGGLPTISEGRVQTRAVNSSSKMLPSATGNSVLITAVAINPAQPDVVYGTGNNGVIYTYSNPGSGGSTGGSGGSGGGGSGGGGSGGGTTSSSGGGGSLGIPGLLLLMVLFGVNRRRFCAKSAD